MMESPIFHRHFGLLCISSSGWTEMFGWKDRDCLIKSTYPSSNWNITVCAEGHHRQIS